MTRLSIAASAAVTLALAIAPAACSVKVARSC